MTAFLHLLALRDHHHLEAEAPSERPEKRPAAPEDAQPLKHPSRAEILGECIIFIFFPHREEALCLIVNNSIHFRAGFASRRHRRCIACLLSGKETIPIVLHKGIMK